MKLPVLDAASRACVSCHGPCCIEHVVPVSGYDLWRLTRSLGVPWAALVDVDFHKIALHDGFRLDRGPKHYFFTLKRRPSGACQFLVELEGGYRRCGVHALRPGPCRRYPLVDADHPDGADFGDHAICPEPQAEMYRAAIGELRHLVDEPQAERALYQRVVERWDILPRTIPVESPLPIDRFLDWIDQVYATLEPLRTGERGAWQPRAYQIVGALAL